jgi:murein DD-endopeptidase MepM/ murein hydrolase activator NlpD
MRQTITAARRLLPRTLVAFALLAGLAMTVPAHADTESELQAARERLEGARGELNRLNTLWQQTEAKLAEAQDGVADARAKIAGLQSDVGSIRRRFNARVRAVYMAGGNGTLGALLGSHSFSEFADRLQFASSIVRDDEDLAIELTVQTEELRRERERLAREAEAEAEAIADLQVQQAAVESKLFEYEDVVAELEEQLDREQQFAIGLPVGAVGGSVSVSVSGFGAIETCPVAGATSFVDSFGWPRPGGRVHEGIDLIAAFGTPVVATHDGTVSQGSSSLGGLGAMVYHDGSSDWTFYAHLSTFGAPGHVSAGTVIGYVGSTGNAGDVNHLHFEYHPAGGAAVNPYSALLAVC